MRVEQRIGAGAGQRRSPHEQSMRCCMPRETVVKTLL